MPLIIRKKWDRETAPEFSENLWKVERPPRHLYVEGQEESFHLVEKLPVRALAMVGTRVPQKRSAAHVERVLSELQDSDLVIVSGFACGIDAVVHENAIRNGLKTIAVLGTGLNSEYPFQNRGLRKKILESGGLLISEFEPDDPGKPDHFIRRNRLIAQWSQATWVVEAASRSGALNTAAWARNAGRFVYATPAFPEDPAFLGNQKLLERDHAIPFWNVESLGAAWLEFANWKQKLSGVGLQRKFSISGGGDSEVLYRKMLDRSKSSGGAEVSDLLDWAMNEGWTPQRFFESAQKAIESGVIAERNGVWIPGKE